MDEESSKCIDPIGKNMNLINMRSNDAVAYTSFIPITI